MAEFPDDVKEEARKKANFMCVMCRKEFVAHVHHITPPEEDGSNDIDNAAPLCAGCHDKYGRDPLKRKEIRQMRDQWYSICVDMYKSPTIQIILPNVQYIYDGKNKIEQGQDPSLIERTMKDNLSDMLITVGNEIRTSESKKDITVLSGYVAAASTALNTSVSETFCRSCGGFVPFGARFCPTCGAPLSLSKSDSDNSRPE